MCDKSVFILYLAYFVNDSGVSFVCYLGMKAEHFRNVNA